MSESDTRPPSPGPASPPRTADADADWTALAASLAAQKTDRPAPPPPDTPPRRTAEPGPMAQRAFFVSALALVLGLIATMVAGMLWWQYREFYVSLDQTDNATAASLERIRADQRALRDGLG